VAFFVNVTAGASGRPGEEALARLRGAGLACGFSATVHAGNAAEFARAGTYDRLAASGAGYGLVLDYLPAIGATGDPLVVGAARRRRVVAASRAAAARLGLLLICAPEDEDALGGCGVAGRALVHVDARGRITPCPFVPYSPFRLGRHSLREALGSDYFRALREAAPRWEAGPGSCTVRKRETAFLELAVRYGAS
jgi:MoaA/NifB/PqqE/SkfB family radical SAM enzyme